MKGKENKQDTLHVHNAKGLSELSFREVLIEKIKLDSYFSPNDFRFVETSRKSN